MRASALVPFLQDWGLRVTLVLGPRYSADSFPSRPMHPTYRVFLLYLLLTFYCFGAAMMAEVVEYQSWGDLGPYLSPAEFAQWHTVAGARALPILVLPMALTTVVAVCLLRYLPRSVPRWCLGIVLACHALAWGSTLRFQLPLELQLDHGAYSPTLLAELWRTDWLRKLAFGVEIPVVSYMGWRFFQVAPLTESAKPMGPTPAAYEGGAWGSWGSRR
jgi:hypothetical protein